MITEAELNKIARVGELSQECLAESQFTNIVTQELMGLFDSGSAVFMEFNHADLSASLSSCTSYGIEQLHGERYIKRHHKLDPCYQQLKKLINTNPQSSVSTDQVIENECVYTNSEYYNEFMQATGVHRSLIFTLAGNSHPVGLIGLHRDKTSPDYQSADHLKAKLIAPYLYTAILFRQKERESQRQSMLENSILNLSNIRGYMLFNQELVCIDSRANSNQADSTILEIDLEHAQGRACIDLVSKEIFKKVANVANSKVLDPLKLSDEFDNLVHGQHIRIEKIVENEKPYVLLLLLRKDIEIVCEQRMDYFKLTNRQKKIVGLVQLGYTNPQISKRLNISTKTVENHLTQIYAKTFTHNKTSLLTQLHV